jgi:hypothetical protein
MQHVDRPADVEPLAQPPHARRPRADRQASGRVARLKCRDGIGRR